MNGKIFNHPAFPDFANVYRVSPEGEVQRLDNGNILTIHDSTESSEQFVRMSNKGKTISISLGKLLLLTYFPNGYKDGRIAVKKDVTKGVELRNLKWGDRQDVSKIQMQKPEHSSKVSKMARTYYDTEAKERYVIENPHLSNKELAANLKVSSSCITIIKKRLAEKTVT